MCRSRLRVGVGVLALGVLAACSPTPRSQAVVASPVPVSGVVAVPATPAPTASAPPTAAVVVTPTVASAAPADTAAPGPTPTRHPDLPDTCYAPPPATGLVIERDYDGAICRSPLVSPDERWVAFIQLTAGGEREQLWLAARETGEAVPITSAAWEGSFYNSLSYIDWSANSALVLVHRYVNGVAPVHVLLPESGELFSLGTASSMAWNHNKRAIVGWQLNDTCVFSAITGWDFETNTLLQSRNPGEEVVGQVFFLPGSSDYIYARATMYGDCPQCVYRASEIVVARNGGQQHEVVVRDRSTDYLLYGYQGDLPVIAARPYQSRACQDPAAVGTDTPATFYTLDVANGTLTEIAP